MLFCENLETFPVGINLQCLYQLNLRGCSRLRSFPDISRNISELNLGKTAIEEFPSKLRLENLVGLDMFGLESWKTWKIVQPLTPLITMLSSSLTRLTLSDIPSLVKLPSSIKKFNKLEYMGITQCTNLETLPTGINLQSLYELDLSGCSRLRTFPDFSINISVLILNETGIEEVPWWLEDFSRLTMLHMSRCNNLLRVSLNFLKLNHLGSVDFSDCWALSEARCDDTPSFVAMARDNYSFPLVELNFVNCFNLDPEALLQQPSVFFNCIRLSGEEVPSLFTHQTTGISLTSIPLRHVRRSEPSFRFKACALVYGESVSMSGHSYSIQVCCRFIDRLGNHFDYADLPLHVSRIEHSGSQLIVFDCSFHLNKENSHLPEVNYDHVDIQFHLSDHDSQLKLSGCGIRLSEDDESREDNDLGNETDHSEEYEDCNDSDLGNEIDHSEDSNGETKRSD